MAGWKSPGRAAMFTLMRKIFSTAACTLALGLFAALPATAQSTPKLIGSFKAWEAYSYQESGSPVCFMLGRPSSSAYYRKGKKVSNVKRGDVYVLVTHRPARNSRNVVSVTSGYQYAEASTVKVKVDSKSYALYTADKAALRNGADPETAWARDEDDAVLTDAMRKGNRMLITGTSKRGTETRDRYSLSGFTAAHKAISKACK